MGQVYEVQHVELGRTAALKMMRPDLAQDEETAARFFTEARAMSMVHHAGLIHVYEYGHMDDGGAYIVMEFAAGPTLRQHIAARGGKLPLLSAVTLAQQIAAALSAAHDRGVVHRDLKPDNIVMVGDDDASHESTIKVLDFGLAKVSAPAPDIYEPRTKPGQVLGTPLYMAPEQAGAPGGIGPHTDVYALGAVLFEMVTGTPPFHADDAAQLVGKHLFSEAPRLRLLRPDVPQDLDELMQSMLAKAPAERPLMGAVKERLKRIRQAIAAGLRNGHDSEPEDSSQAETMLLRGSKARSAQPDVSPLALLGWPSQKLPTFLLAGILSALLLWSVWNSVRPALSPSSPANVVTTPVVARPTEVPKQNRTAPPPVMTIPAPAQASATPPEPAGTGGTVGTPNRRRPPRPATPPTKQAPAARPAASSLGRPVNPAIKFVD